MRTWMFSCLLGNLLAHQLIILPSNIYLLLFLALFFSTISTHFLAKAISAIFLGFIWTIASIHQFNLHQIPQYLEGQNAKITIQITQVPEIKNLYTTLYATLTKSSLKMPTPMKVRLTAPHDLKFHVGETWEVTARLKKPRDMHEGLHAIGSILKDTSNHKISNSSVFFFENIRQSVFEHLEMQLKDQPLLGLLEGILIGIRTRITQDQWELFRNTGTVHLLVIAGLHIGFVASLIYALASALWARTGLIYTKMPTQTIAAGASAIAAWLYAALAGFSIPTQRAFIMMFAILISQIFRRNMIAFERLALALGAVLILDPFATLSASFWMSFGAVACITLANQQTSTSIIKQWLHIQIALTIGLIPLTLFYFQQTSIISMIANLIAIPWVGFWVIPPALLGVCFIWFPPISHALFQFAIFHFQGVVDILQFLTRFPAIIWVKSIPSPTIFLFLLMSLLLVFAPKGFPARWLAFIFLLPFFFYRIPQPNTNEAWIHVLDVGQGLSVVIQTHQHVLVFDTGPPNNVLVPFLRNHQIKNVDTLIISHADIDHRGGADSLLKYFPTEMLLTSDPNRFKNNGAQYCKAGQHWAWEGVQFEVLAPFLGVLDSGNDNSCVLRIEAGKQAILIPGDIEKNAESLLLLKYPREKLKTKILIAPHHGSLTSSTEKWIAAVAPEIVIFSVGHLNRYHLPHPKVIKKYSEIGAKLYKTSDFGTIELQLRNSNQ